MSPPHYFIGPPLSFSHLSVSLQDDLSQVLISLHWTKYLSFKNLFLLKIVTY